MDSEMMALDLLADFDWIVVGQIGSCSPFNLRTRMMLLVERDSEREALCASLLDAGHRMMGNEEFHAWLKSADPDFEFEVGEPFDIEAEFGRPTKDGH